MTLSSPSEAWDVQDSDGTRTRAARARRAPPLTVIPREGPLRQSFAQERLWFLSRLDAGGFSYNIAFFARLVGPLDADALEQALRALWLRHESLRTTFGEEGGQPVQRVAPVPDTVLVTETLSEYASPEALRERAEQEAQRPFDLERGPVFRATLVKLAPDAHALLLAQHHIVGDAWSLGVLARELAALYGALTQGAEPRLAPLPVQYADFARWQRDWLEAGARDEQLSWWIQRLAGVSPVLALPTDRRRPPVQTFRGASFRTHLPAGLTEALQRCARAEGVTLFMTLLAAYQVLLARYSGQEDIIVGSPISGRVRRELEGLIGFFVNTLPLHTRVAPQDTFHTLLGRVREHCLGAFANQDVPFEHIVDAVQPTRDLSRTPLFQAMLTLQLGFPELTLPGLASEELDFEPGFAKFDLTLFMRETPQGLVNFWEYNTALFDEDTVRRMAANHVRLLEAVVAHPEARLGTLPLLSDAERHRLLVEWASRRDDSFAPDLIHHWVQAQVLRTPHAEAVTDGTHTLTYAQLDARANQLAWHLRALGVPPLGTVGLCLERASLDMPVAVLATMKAGAAFLPLDPNLPGERLALMLEDTGAPVVLAHAGPARALPATLQARVVRLERAAEELATRPARTPSVDISPEAPCYFVYTSGSTGRPKGIVMSHRAVGNMLGWLLQRAVNPTATTLQFASLNFDVSFQEMFGTWCLGGRVLLVSTETRRDPTALLHHLLRHGVERLFLPFVALQSLADAALSEERLPPLNEVITAGEQLQVTPALVSLFERLPGCVLENQYGPSEAHVVTAWRARGAPSTWPSLPPIGEPIPNLQVLVLDDHGQLSPIGVPGEVHVGGASLAHGYHGRPDLTADRFVPSRFGTTPGARLYRTGDQARWLADGTLEFLGRRDGQVKLRGFRIELGEVEAVLRAQPGVKDAIVVVREDSPGARRLVGYVVLPASAWEPESLRAALARRLPEYMLPSALVRLDVLPLMPTGKVDRKGLPVPALSQSLGGTHVAPRTELEQRLTQVWEEVLGTRPIGVTDSFFALGGHSLSALRLLSRIRGLTGRALPVATLFEHPTVETLAAHLRHASREVSPLVELRGGAAHPPFFCVHPVGGTVLSYAELVRALGPERPLYGLQARGLEGEAAPLLTIPAMAEHYLSAVRARQPHGPYLLGGWSMGGSIAWEMATRLTQQGEQVALLALIDTYARPFAEGQTPDLERERSRFGALFYEDLLRATGRSPSDTEPLQSLRHVFEANLMAAWTYETPTYSGPVLSLESSASPRPHEWEHVATGPLEVHVIPGDHYSILQPGSVEVLAAHLRAAFPRAFLSRNKRDNS
ncbi:amino acid adenylation domain-containing protein [Corallococcus sp. M34]|uniref:non-ribosomal peptide synthetase n=1 Tax=Citreicoccus inhibens TaxID=2849499 RepID=UPI001C21DDF7|nr:non-ribosomal peptide synthetase [Citreicoccus inhibens]MBU8898145.1 amino acid adenylation domain-containing protein [Citreicoccus inhibens]